MDIEFSFNSRVGDALSGIAQALGQAGIEHADNEARLLLSSTFGVSSSDITLAVIMGTSLRDLQSAGHCPISTAGAQEKNFRLLRQRVMRRQAREPLQYIVGYTPFRFLKISVGPGVFIPRPETETLVQIGLDWLRGKGQSIKAERHSARAEGHSPGATASSTGEGNGSTGKASKAELGPDNGNGRGRPPARPRIADLCAGSGAVGLSVLTECPGTEVYAVEISGDALEWAHKNADKICWADPSAKNRYHLVHGDATDPAIAGTLGAGRFDAVLSNPPYVPLSRIPQQPEVRKYDPDIALYGGSADGLDIPQKIIISSSRLLRPGGLLVMEHDISQAAALRSFASRNGFSDVRTRRDLTGRDRFLTAIKR
ncbi:MAG: N5-glutamine methyltransferase family protein [Scardovia wiggsiae]